MLKRKTLPTCLFFIFSVFFLHFFFVPKAYADMTCSWIAGADNVDDYPNTGAVNRDYFFHVDANKLASDVILGRYFSYGDGGWVSVSAQTSYSDYDWLSVPLHKYLLGKDYTAGGGWVYRNGSGQVKTLSCPICTRIYDVREVRNFGIKKLTYPTVSNTQVISGSKAYLGPFWSYNTSAFNGNNNGFLPDPAIVGGDLNAWWWRVGTDYDYGGNGVTAGWFGHNGIFRDGSYYVYPSLLVPSVTFNLTAATFKAGEGTGANANYDFNNMVVYSRDLQKNADGTCGSLPSNSVVASGQYFGKSQCEARVDTKKGWCLLNPALGQINLSDPNDPINTWKWSYFSFGNSSAITQTPTTIPTVRPTLAPTQIPTIPPKPTVTPTPKPGLNCQGQYFGKPQCDWRALATYGSGGTCQLNPALGTINPSNPNDPINDWKWSYCK